MKQYELITEKHQPSCSGEPIKHELSEISTDDPVKYVKSLLKNATLSVEKDADGSTEITAEDGDNQYKFVFTEI